MVNILLRFAFALILFYAVAGQLIEGPVQLPSVFATNGNVMHSTFNGSTYNAAGGNYIVVQDQIYDGSSRIIVFIRDQGTYATRRAQQQPWPRWAELMSTNGNWIGTLDENGFIDTFQVNSTNSFVNITSFASSARFIQFLSDDTLVLIDQSSIDTYEYFEGNWTKILHQNVSFLVNPYLTRTVERANDSVPHLTDTTLAAFDPVRRVVELYSRSADKSWTLVDEISIDPQYHVSRIIWNGDDTVIVSDIIYMIRDPDTLQNDVGRILIHQKNGGSWNLTNIIYNADVTTNPGYLGFSMLLINRDLIAISAPFDQGTGTVFYLQRRPGIEWQFTTQFVGDYRLNFGFSLMRTDYDVVIQSGGRANASPLPNARQTLIPPCYLPIQHQCQNVTTDTCQPFDVSHDELYTVGDPCTVVTLENIQFNGDSSTLAFSFSRLTGEFETLYCNSTITCTNPPTTLINPSDPNSNVPASPSPQSSSPISIAPVASPSEGGRRRTSNSPLLWLDIAAIGCAAIVSLV